MSSGRALQAGLIGRILGITLVAGAVLASALTDGAYGQAASPLSASASAPMTALPSFAPLAKRVLPAVVNVSAVLKPGAAAGDDSDQDQSLSPFDELLRRFFEQQGIAPPQPNPNSRDIALGSGFIIDPSGYIVTNGHVVQNAERVTVIFNDNSRHRATIVGQDALTDLALLKIDAPTPLPSVSWGDSESVEVGDWVLAIGNPFGLGNTISFGIVSARGRDIHAGPYDDFLQIDASINRGNSGGPTFDLRGAVIGVNTAIYSPNGGSVGIGFAIPASIAKPVIDQIRAHGKVARGWIGVQIQEVTPAIAKNLGLPDTAGALVADVSTAGPAAKAGLKPGDVVLSFDHHAIAKLRDLSATVAQTPIGAGAAIEVWRNGGKVVLTATVAAMPDNPQIAHNAEDNGGGSGRSASPQSVTVRGLELAALSDQLRRAFHIGSQVRGVLVLGVAARSPFAGQNIAPADVIVAINQQPVATPADVQKRFADTGAQKEGGLLCLLNRSGSPLFVTLSLAGPSPP